jgi:uncharacterized tellurite resistance protein B-like protein
VRHFLNGLKRSESMNHPVPLIRLETARCGKIVAVMLQNLKQFFDQHILPSARGKGESADHALQVATAALLFEVMRMNGELKEVERHAMMAAIHARFNLTAEETAALTRLGEAEAKQATDYYQFTALINKHYTASQKEQVVEHLWQVAAADLEIDRFERTLVHKVADLLHVPRPAQIAARERALRSARQESK